MPAPPIDAYLLPAVVGGGLGDIEEVIAVGRALSSAGVRVVLFRAPGRPLPRSVAGPWDWPRPLERAVRVTPRAPWALTVSASWGVAAAPSRPEPYGRGGPWEVESRAIEAAYGADRTLHISLEEFARTLTSREETIERWREGGLSHREIRRRLRLPETRAAIAEFHDAYRRFRAFDRPNLLALYPTFRYATAFAREFPEAIQTGPLWPCVAWPRGRAPTRRRDVVWYASPSTSVRLLPRVLPVFEKDVRLGKLLVRSPVPIEGPAAAGRSVRLSVRPLRPSTWRRAFAHARLRIVTGSRTLLEAIECGGPFLYFNGITGNGSHARVHRPEKLRSWLALARVHGVDARLRHDLASFARGQDVGNIVARAVRREGRWARFPSRLPPTGFRPPFESVQSLLRCLVPMLRADGPPAAAHAEKVRRAARSDATRGERLSATGPLARSLIPA